MTPAQHTILLAHLAKNRRRVAAIRRYCSLELLASDLSVTLGFPVDVPQLSAALDLDARKIRRRKQAKR